MSEESFYVQSSLNIEDSWDERFCRSSLDATTVSYPGLEYPRSQVHRPAGFSTCSIISRVYRNNILLEFTYRQYGKHGLSDIESVAPVVIDHRTIVLLHTQQPTHTRLTKKKWFITKLNITHSEMCISKRFCTLTGLRKFWMVWTVSLITKSLQISPSMEYEKCLRYPNLKTSSVKLG